MSQRRDLREEWGETEAVRQTGLSTGHAELGDVGRRLDPPAIPSQIKSTVARGLRFLADSVPGGQPRPHCSGGPSAPESTPRTPASWDNGPHTWGPESQGRGLGLKHVPSERWPFLVLPCPPCSSHCRPGLRHCLVSPLIQTVVLGH